MNQEERTHMYREWVATLACVIYTGENWDKQAVASFLHMGDPSLNYEFPGEPSDELTLDEAMEAMDRIFERAGI